MQAFTDPIIAVSTAPGRGAVGIVRISGKNLKSFSQQLLGKKLETREAKFCRLRDQSQELIDEVLALFFQSPESFTGEDVLELQGHGGQQVLQRIIKRCFEVSSEQTFGHEINEDSQKPTLLPHLRLANPGEFTQRAFLNNKIDLVQAESIMDLIDASTELAAKSASRSLSGAFSKAIDQLLEQVTLTRVMIEAQIDFPEEEIEELQSREIEKTAKEIKEAIESTELILSKAKQGVLLKEGLKTVIVGQTNVGKSSLMNQLCEQEVSIVTDIAGTTRDLIKQTLQIDGIPIHLIDTAGINQQANERGDVVEQMGIERAWRELEQAQLILFVHDLSRIENNDYLSSEQKLFEQINFNISPHAIIVHVWNKIDLCEQRNATQRAETLYSSWELSNEKPLLISTKDGQGLSKLKADILHRLGWDMNLGEDVFSARERHLLALREVLMHLKTAQSQAKANQKNLDLIAEEMRLAQNALSNITGEFNSDDLLGEIFSKFCIGK